MRKLRIFEHISLDGVIQHSSEPSEDGDFPYAEWTGSFRSPAGAAALAAAYSSRFDLLLGRRTYDVWSDHWPKVKGGPFADGINAATKYVATHRPESLDWGPVEALGDDVVEGVRRVKGTDGADLIVWGSSTLTSVLFDKGLVDEVVLVVYPVLLGQGKRILSSRVAARELALVSSQSTPTGVLVNSYRYVGALQKAQ